MVSITDDGITAEGETLAKARAALRKAKAAAEALAKIASDNGDHAHDRAMAAIGRIALGGSWLERSSRLVRGTSQFAAYAHPSDRGSPERNWTSIGHMSATTQYVAPDVEMVAVSPAGHVFAVRRIGEWYTLGACGEEWSTIRVPAALEAILEAMTNE